jgi:fatty acid desaturase
MKSKLKALYRRLGRPPVERLAAAAAGLAALALVAIALAGGTRVMWAVSALMSLVTFAGLLLVWTEARTARREARESAERTEVTYRRILAAFEVERLAAERRHAREGRD